ncbi:signal peptidase II [Murinocardiopsis flavida]|uniref:signal peptidase II n=1 Tax=Murinocardiopsis flavida TaxID=645275 RepID=UPI001FE7F1EC|nr:signal peptidase II [Murinocardiopsis flavida]
MREQHPGADDAPQSTGSTSRPAAPKPRRALLLAAVAAVVVLADLATKTIALSRFSAHEPIAVLGEFLQFTLWFNSGAAFSMGTGMTWVFSLIKLAVIGYIAFLARRLRSTGWAVALGMILGGAAGNVIDRIFRPPYLLNGEVIDWIQLPNWPVFNLADSSIVCAGVLAVLLAFRGINIDGTREGDDADPAEASDGAGGESRQ